MIPVYLAGPMRGIAQFNFPAFDFATAKLREQGFDVFSPADNDRAKCAGHPMDDPQGNEANAARTIAECMKDDTSWICDNARIVALLPGWQTSTGATAEEKLGRALGLTIMELGREYVMDRAPAPANKAAPPSTAIARTAIAPPPRRLLPSDSGTRKTFPVATGVVDYFPDALAAVAEVSFLGNQKHNPGEPLHWARGKSMDHVDCAMRHLIERGGFDGKLRHTACLAWRALAMLQEELEAAHALSTPRGATDLPPR